jgi:hypothetical protein
VLKRFFVQNPILRILEHDLGTYCVILSCFECFSIQFVKEGIDENDENGKPNTVCSPISQNVQSLGLSSSFSFFFFLFLSF